MKNGINSFSGSNGFIPESFAVQKLNCLQILTLCPCKKLSFNVIKLARAVNSNIARKNRLSKTQSQERSQKRTNI